MASGRRRPAGSRHWSSPNPRGCASRQ
jgi:hypothetical protein